jgi:hypothetical protein
MEQSVAGDLLLKHKSVFVLIVLQTSVIAHEVASQIKST